MKTLMTAYEKYCNVAAAAAVIANNEAMKASKTAYEKDCNVAAAAAVNTTVEYIRDY